MIKRFTLIALLGFILSIAYAGTAQAEIYLVSPTTVETPATVVLASEQPNMNAGCVQGVPDPNNNGVVYPETISESGCEMYYVKRTGPEASGLYYFSWRMPIAPTGQVVIEARVWPDNSASAEEKGFPFTVTGSRLKYGDFQSCIHPKTTKALIAYYARMTTAVVFRVEVKKGLFWKPWKSKETLVKVGGKSGNAVYSRRFVQFKVPVDILPPKEARKYEGYEKRHVRARYLIKQGKKVIKEGYVSRRLCRELPLPPYVLP